MFFFFFFRNIMAKSIQIHCSGSEPNWTLQRWSSCNAAAPSRRGFARCPAARHLNGDTVNIFCYRKLLDIVYMKNTSMSIWFSYPCAFLFLLLWIDINCWNFTSIMTVLHHYYILLYVTLYSWRMEVKPGCHWFVCGSFFWKWSTHRESIFCQTSTMNKADLLPFQLPMSRASWFSRPGHGSIGRLFSSTCSEKFSGSSTQKKKNTPKTSQKLTTKMKIAIDSCLELSSTSFWNTLSEIQALEPSFGDQVRLHSQSLRGVLCWSSHGGPPYQRNLRTSELRFQHQTVTACCRTSCVEKQIENSCWLVSILGCTCFRGFELLWKWNSLP